MRQQALNGANCELTAECSRRVEGLVASDSYVLSLHNPNPGETVQQFAVSVSVTLSVRADVDSSLFVDPLVLTALHAPVYHLCRDSAERPSATSVLTHTDCVRLTRSGSLCAAGLHGRVRGGQPSGGAGGPAQPLCAGGSTVVRVGCCGAARRWRVGALSANPLAKCHTQTSSKS